MPQKHKKTAFERYSLRPHERREIIATVQGKTVCPDAIRGLAAKYGCATKMIHEIVTQVNGVEAVNANTPRAESTTTFGEECATRSRKKLTLFSHRASAQKQSTSQPEGVEADTRRRLELDRKEQVLRRRENDLLARERRVAQDTMEVEEALKVADSLPLPEEITKRDTEIADLRQRLQNLSDEHLNRVHNKPKTRVYSEGVVAQLLLVKDAEIAKLQRKIDAMSAQGESVPESLRIM